MVKTVRKIHYEFRKKNYRENKFIQRNFKAPSTLKAVKSSQNKISRKRYKRRRKIL